MSLTDLGLVTCTPGAALWRARVPAGWCTLVNSCVPKLNHDILNLLKIISLLSTITIIHNYFKV